MPPPFLGRGHIDLPLSRYLQPKACVQLNTAKFKVKIFILSSVICRGNCVLCTHFCLLTYAYIITASNCFCFLFINIIHNIVWSSKGIQTILRLDIPLLINAEADNEWRIVLRCYGTSTDLSRVFKTSKEMSRRRIVWDSSFNWFCLRWHHTKHVFVFRCPG